MSGSRDWPWNHCGPIYSRLTEVVGDQDVTVVEGDCPFGGVDTIARVWANYYPRARSEKHPAMWFKHGKGAGPIRNQEMVDLGADVVLAYPMGVSRGTRDLVVRAREAGLVVRVFPWPGDFEDEHWPE